MPAFDLSDLGRVFREESGRAVATLVRLFGDVSIAEEAQRERDLGAGGQRWVAAGEDEAEAVVRHGTDRLARFVALVQESGLGVSVIS